jgi:hypothetical protein
MHLTRCNGDVALGLGPSYSFNPSTAIKAGKIVGLEPESTTSFPFYFQQIAYKRTQLVQWTLFMI